jgi:hypothetical protein
MNVRQLLWKLRDVNRGNTNELFTTYNSGNKGYMNRKDCDDMLTGYNNELKTYEKDHVWETMD